MDNNTITKDNLEELTLSSIRLHSYKKENPMDMSQLPDCVVNAASPAQNHLQIAIPEHAQEIAKLTNCYLQAFRAAKNQNYRSLALPLFGTETGSWSLQESVHSLKNALMIFWRSGALDGEVFPDMDLWLLAADEEGEREVSQLCESAFSVFLCDLPDWNAKGDRRMWEHLMHVFAEKNVETEEEFLSTVLDEYRSLTGSIPENAAGKEPNYVKVLDFGGAGGGLVSDVFWENTVIPVLKRRFAERR